VRRDTTTRSGGERGFATVEYLAAVALSLLFLVLIINFLVVQYARGVLRAAVDEGVRDASRYFEGEDTVAVAARCEQRGQEVLRNLLGGQMGRGLSIRCTVNETTVAASIDARFKAWLPGLPEWNASTDGHAARERPF
jgi:hypothetical protein